MTNDELKKKMVDTMHPILKGTRVSCNEENACEHCLFPCEVDRIADRLADALIAAGYGDVKEAEHRAEVAEQALLFLCDTTISDISVMVFPKTKTQVRNKQELYDYCIEQAEKELAEERKDGNKTD